MVRIVVIALVLANVMLLAFQLLRPQPPVTGVSVGAVDPVDTTGPIPEIRLMSELAEVTVNPEGTAECFTLGPFETEESKSEALKLLAGSAIAITERRTEAVVDRGTWVYLPVQPDYVTARSMALTMRDAGLGDVNVIMEGEWRFSVSLGYFSSEANAARRMREARSLGFAVETRTQRDIEPRYWVDYEQRAGAPYVVMSDAGPITPELQRYIPCATAPDAGSD